MGDAADDMMDMAFALMDSPEFDGEHDTLSPWQFGFWRTKGGQLVRISEMEDSHLVNTARLLLRKVGDMPKAIEYELEYRKIEVSNDRV